jgi:hypothetical protein
MTGNLASTSFEETFGFLETNRKTHNIANKALLCNNEVPTSS